MKILNNLLLFCTALAMISCDGPIGYIIHKLKTDTQCYSYNTTDTIKDDTIRFVISKNNRMLLKAEINGVEDTVQYDSGAGMAAALFYDENNKPEDLKFYRMYLMGADKLTKMRMTTIPVEIKTPMCTVNHFGEAFLVSNNHSCDNEKEIYDYNIIGFAGLDFRPLAINFTKKQIYHLKQQAMLDTTGYIPVKCKFDKKVLFIYPIINGIEYECVFDTGNDFGILIKDKQRVKNKSDNDLLYEGIWGKAIGGTTKKQSFVVSQETTIEFAGIKETTPVVYLESNLANNNVGLQYIKRFDWIIDTEFDTVRHDNENHYWIANYKMYAKPHNADTLKMRSKPRYGIFSTNNTLTINSRLLDGNEVFKVGDRIVSVDGVKITEENICDYYDLLTSKEDWSEFDIKVE